MTSNVVSLYVDEPEFGDGDGDGPDGGRIFCPLCMSRAFALLADGTAECFNCAVPLAILWEEGEGE